MAKKNAKPKTRTAAPHALPPWPAALEDVPLPPYLRAHWNEGSSVIHYRIDVSTRMRQNDFPIRSMRLGTDLHRALAIYDAQFAPILAAWKENASALAVDRKPVFGSLEWMHVEYKKTERYKALSATSSSGYDKSIRRCCNHVMLKGRFAGQLFGRIPVRWITEDDADAFYAEYVVKVRTDGEGKKTVGRRERTAKLDVETLRAMINALMRKHKNLLYDKTNVFSGVFMPYRVVSPVPVPLEWLARFIRASDRKGLNSVSAIVLYAWELLARVTHFPFEMHVDHFRGPNHEDELFVDAEKVHESGWFDLWNDDDELMYPALTERLAKLKGNRFGEEEPLFLSERSDRTRPWKPTELRAVIAEICEDAKLPKLTLSQFRKGGMAEANLAGLTPAEFVATSMHKDYATVKKHYTQRSPELAAAGQAKRLGLRRKKAKRGVDIVT